MSVKAISKLAEIRKQSGITQAQLAVLVGVTTNTIQNWEKRDGLAQLEKYLKLGEVFGLKNLEELVEYVEIPDKEDSKGTKGFSMNELRQIRESWGTAVAIGPNDEPLTPDKNSSNPKKPESPRKI